MLQAKSIALRHVRETDINALISCMNDLQIRGEYLLCALTSPSKIYQQFQSNGLSSDEYERLLLVDAEDRLLGSLWHFKSVPYFNAREIGYTLYQRAERNRGCMSEALGLLVDYLFSSQLINRLEIRMSTLNKASEPGGGRRSRRPGGGVVPGPWTPGRRRELAGEGRRPEVRGPPPGTRKWR